MSQKWTVEFEIDDSWVEDGFDLTPEVAKEMIEQRLPFAYPGETKVKIIKSPSPDVIHGLQSGEAV